MGGRSGLNGVGRYLVWSDIPNNVQCRWLAEDNHISVFRNPSNNRHGNTFDWQGRQVSCEHATRRVVRYETNGQVTTLAEKWQGKLLNGPNDVVVHPDGGIWFTDPGYGTLSDYEGNKGELYIKEAVYRIDPKTGAMDMVTDALFKPNGLCFSPDYKKLYIVETGSSHYPAAPSNARTIPDLAEIAQRFLPAFQSEAAIRGNPARRVDATSDRPERPRWKRVATPRCCSGR